MEQVGLGIIGIGNIGFTHARCVFDQKISGLVLRAVCDSDPQRQAVTREQLPGVSLYADYRQLLEDPAVDAVLIAVPHPMHAQIATDAFVHGKHVLVEKPLDITVSRARSLNDAAAKSGKQFAIMFNQRTGQLFAKARQLFHSGQLGQLKRTTWIATNWYRTQHYYDSGSWRATWAGEGGGVLMNQAPHQLDLWQWICGMPRSVSAVCDTGRYHRIEVEDSATLLVRFPNGAQGMFITSTGEYPGTNRLEIVGTLGKLVLEEGKLKWWQLSRDQQEASDHDSSDSTRIPWEYQEFTQEQGVSGHQMILQNFTNAILHNEALIAPGYEGINELMLQNAAYLSAWKGSVPVELPFDEKEYDRLLEQHQKSSSAPKASSPSALHTDYAQRWQINW